MSLSYCRCYCMNRRISWNCSLRWLCRIDMCNVLCEKEKQKKTRDDSKLLFACFVLQRCRHWALNASAPIASGFAVHSFCCCYCGVDLNLCRWRCELAHRVPRTRFLIVLFTFWTQFCDSRQNSIAQLLWTENNNFFNIKIIRWRRNRRIPFDFYWVGIASPDVPTTSCNQMWTTYFHATKLFTNISLSILVECVVCSGTCFAFDMRLVGVTRYTVQA